jgi:hypothetical protein
MVKQSELSIKGQQLALKFLATDPQNADAETWFTAGLMGEFYEWLVKEGKVKIAEIE